MEWAEKGQKGRPCWNCLPFLFLFIENHLIMQAYPKPAAGSCFVFSIIYFLFLLDRFWDGEVEQSLALVFIGA